MLQNVPTKKDFENAAIARLNLAWEAVLSLVNLIESAELESWDDDGSVADAFWAASQQSLGNAHALIHQGIELLLKGHIAAVSPYLLLSRRIQDWPIRPPHWTADFSAFHTVDAADLVKLFNTVCPRPLSEPFTSMIEAHRKERNTFTHSIGSTKSHDPLQLWKVILEVVHELIAPRSWFGRRRTYAEADPAVVAHGNDHLLTGLAKESEMLLDALTDREKEKYFGWRPTARAYVCYHCATDYHDAAIRPLTAQIVPTQTDDIVLTCFTCDGRINAYRKRCIFPSCDGDLVETTDQLCLTCFENETSSSDFRFTE